MELVESTRLAFQVIELQSNCEVAIHRSADFERLVMWVLKFNTSFSRLLRTYDLDSVLEEIKKAVTTWAEYSALDGFLRRSHVSTEIKRMMRDLDLSLEIFNVSMGKSRPCSEVSH